jgi:hypothetical protein
LAIIRFGKGISVLTIPLWPFDEPRKTRVQDLSFSDGIIKE